MEDELGGIKLEMHRNVHEVSQSLLVNLEAPAVAMNCRDDTVAHRDKTFPIIQHFQELKNTFQNAKHLPESKITS